MVKLAGLEAKLKAVEAENVKLKQSAIVTATQANNTFSDSRDGKVYRIVKIGNKVAGTKLKAKSGWSKDGNGTDEYGFSALPGSNSSDLGTSFSGVGYNGDWWSSSEYNSSYAYTRTMSCSNEFAEWYSVYKTYLFSVRCLQDMR